MREQPLNDLESRKLELVEKLGLKEQWESQVRALQQIGGILNILSNYSIGIVGIDGKEYPLPTYEDILEKITTEKLELLEKKTEQGFNQLLLVPFGLPLEALIARYRSLLLKKDKEGNLYSTNGDKLELNRNEPVRVAEDYLKKKIVYYPRNFLYEEESKTKTKKELLDEGNAWEILLLENLSSTTQESQGEKLNKGTGRASLESEKLFEALEILQNDPNYTGEEGLTIEAWLIQAMSYLQSNNQQIDDPSGEGRSCNLLGSYFVRDMSQVPLAYWDRNDQQFVLNGNSPLVANAWNHNEEVRSSVKI